MSMKGQIAEKDIQYVLFKKEPIIYHPETLYIYIYVYIWYVGACVCVWVFSGSGELSGVFSRILNPNHKTAESVKKLLIIY